MTAREAVAKSLKDFEGGDSNHPLDHGGLTHYGLTLLTFREYKRSGTGAELLALSRDQVVDIITELFVLKPGLWRIADPWLLFAVVDFAINAGQRTAVKALQRALGVDQDGLFGTATEYALKQARPDKVFRCLMAERFEHYARIVAFDASQRVFLKGWVARAATILREAA